LILFGQLYELDEVVDGALMWRSEFAHGEEKHSSHDAPFLRRELEGEGAKVKVGEEPGELVGDGLVDDVLAVVGFLATKRLCEFRKCQNLDLGLPPQEISHFGACLYLSRRPVCSTIRVDGLFQ
jgi:hypothetical protein